MLRFLGKEFARNSNVGVSWEKIAVRVGIRRRKSMKSASWKMFICLAVFGSTGLISCQETLRESPNPEVAEWVFCADVWVVCNFDGTRDVRLVQGKNVTLKEMYARANCRPDRFGVTGADGYCEYSSNFKTRTIENPSPGMSGLGGTVKVPIGHSGFSDARRATGADSGDPAGDGVGAARFLCHVSHFSFDDPIVYPGNPGAAHLHIFLGNTNIDYSSTASSIASSGKSTCSGGILNRTAYWAPAMIDGLGNVQMPTIVDQTFYYKTGYRGVKPADIQNMPPGLRMIAGNASSTSTQTLAEVICINGGPTRTGNGSIKALVEAGCTSLEFTVEFPQCWDGVNLDSVDHKSHMAYAIPGKGCPSSHNVPLPVITINLIYQVPANRTAAIGLHLSSDMYDYDSAGGGFSAHSDWFNGWDSATSDIFVKNCLNLAKDCHGYLLGDGTLLEGDPW